MYGPTPKISISTSTPGPCPPPGTTTKASIEPPSGMSSVSVRVVGAKRGRLLRRRELLRPEPDPVRRVVDPEAHAVAARVHAEERVRHVRAHELLVQLLVGRAEAVVV